MAWNSISISTKKGGFFDVQRGFNKFSAGLEVSIGRAFLSGVPFTGTLTVTVVSAQGSYSYSGITSPFVIYPYTDASNNPISHTITVAAVGYAAILVVTPSPAGFIDFDLVAADVRGLATRVQNVLAVDDARPPATDLCLCARTCVYEELALHSQSDTAPHKNDSSAFLFDLKSSTGSIGLELWKGGAKIADLNTDDYGKHYPSFTAQPYYYGYRVDWRAVAGLHGNGAYQVRASITLFGASYEYESRVFRVLPYTDELADGTVKLEGHQSGRIVGALDYTGLIDGGWYASYRIEGRFGDKSPTLELDSYQASDYTIQQIRDSVKRAYMLETHLLPQGVADWLTEDAILSNELLVTDYNINNISLYRRLPVKVDNIEETSHFAQVPRAKYVIKFGDATPNIIKRNF